MAFRVRVAWTGIAGAPYLSTFYYENTTHPTAQDAVDQVEGYLTSLATVLVTGLVATCEAEVVEYSTPDTPVATHVATVTPIAMAGGTLYLGTALQGLIQLRTGIYVGAREVRGRTFVPGLRGTANDGAGKPSGSFLTALNTAAGILAVPGLLVASKKNNLFYEVAAATPWNEFAVLRSRRD